MLNETQKNMIRAVVNDDLDEIVSSLPDNPSREDITLRMTALVCLTSPTPKSQIQEYKDKNVWSEIIRTIYEHDYPQNRCENYPYFGKPSSPSFVVFKDKDGKADFEFRGLLGLSARNDDTALPVERWDVIHYIEKLINEKIDLLNKKLRKLPEPEVKNESLQNKSHDQDIWESMFVMFPSAEIIGSSMAKGRRQVEFTLNTSCENSL